MQAKCQRSAGVGGGRWRGLSSRAGWGAPRTLLLRSPGRQECGRQHGRHTRWRSTGNSSHPGYGSRGDLPSFQKDRALQCAARPRLSWLPHRMPRSCRWSDRSPSSRGCRSRPAHTAVPTSCRTRRIVCPPILQSHSTSVRPHRHCPPRHCPPRKARPARGTRSLRASSRSRPSGSPPRRVRRCNLRRARHSPLPCPRRWARWPTNWCSSRRPRPRPIAPRWRGHCSQSTLRGKHLQHVRTWHQCAAPSPPNSQWRGGHQERCNEPRRLATIAGWG